MTRTALAALLLLAACGKKNPTPDAQPLPQTGVETSQTEPDTEAVVVDDEPTSVEDLAFLDTRWDLVWILGDEVESVEGRDPYLIIEGGTPPNIAGFAGCNRLFGTELTADATHIDFGMMGTTRMACARLGLEQRFLSTLTEAVDGWEIVDGTDGPVLLLKKGSEDVLRFNEGVLVESELDE